MLLRRSMADTLRSSGAFVLWGTFPVAERPRSSGADLAVSQITQVLATKTPMCYGDVQRNPGDNGLAESGGGANVQDTKIDG